MDIKVTMCSGACTTLRVQPDTTVGSLKTLVSEHFGVATASQRLSHVNGQKISLSDDSRSLSSYGLQSGSEVWLLVTAPIQVFLKNDKGQTKTYDIKPGETVRQFKSKVHNKEKVPVEQQILLHQSRQMEDAQTLESYDVKAGSTIFLNLRLRGG